MTDTRKLTLAAVLTAVAVLGSLLSFPVLGSRCAPVQHMVNVFCAVLLGWRYGVSAAFVASLLRNLFGLGTIFAFPGSMIGAFLSGIVYARTKNILLTVVAEAFGTGIIGGLLAYPIAVFILGQNQFEIVKFRKGDDDKDLSINGKYPYFRILIRRRN